MKSKENNNLTEILSLREIYFEDLETFQAEQKMKTELQENDKLQRI